jgi:SMC interacting uncharacterized protein involved in chromosome segregation
MFDSILRLFGLGGGKKELKATVRLEIIQKQIEEFNESKKQINEKINSLEGKTDELGQEITKTLDITKENQASLDNIEESLQKIIGLTEKMIVSKEKVAGNGIDGVAK